MRKLNDIELETVRELIDKAEKLDFEICYSPNEPALSDLVTIYARLEWMSRKLAALGIMPYYEHSYQIDELPEEEDISFPISFDLLRYVSYNVSWSFVETCGPQFMQMYCEALGWNFCSMSSNCIYDVADITSSILGDLDMDEVYEGVVLYNPLFSRILDNIDAVGLKGAKEAEDFIASFPEYLISHWLVGDRKGASYAYVMSVEGWECSVGYETQLAALPFKLILLNHYGAVLLEKYPFLAEERRAVAVV